MPFNLSRGIKRLIFTKYCELDEPNLYRNEFITMQEKNCCPSFLGPKVTNTSLTRLDDIGKTPK